MLLPEAVEVVSMPSIPDTSETIICPVALAPSVAVTVVDPDVPDEANPAQISAVPPPDVPKPATDCQVTPPPVTVVASKPAPLRAALLMRVATKASPAVTPWGKLTDHEVEDPAFEASWTTLGGPAVGPAARITMEISHAAEDGDHENEAVGVCPAPVCHHVETGRDPPADPEEDHPDGVEVTAEGE